MKAILVHCEKEFTSGEKKARSIFSVVPKDAERDLIPLIQKIGRGVVFDVPDDLGNMREVAGILERVDETGFYITVFCEILDSAKRIRLGGGRSIVMEGLNMYFPYTLRGHVIDIKLYGKETICKRVSSYVKSKLDELLSGTIISDNTEDQEVRVQEEREGVE